MHGVRCDGTERRLDACPHFMWDPDDDVCDHTMDVLLECHGGEASTQGATEEECTISELRQTLAAQRITLETQNAAIQTTTQNLTDRVEAEVTERQAADNWERFQWQTALTTERSERTTAINTLTSRVNGKC